MHPKSERVSSIVLLGLADDLVPELERVLSDERHAVYSRPFPAPSLLLKLIDELHAEIVFCAAAPTQYTRLLEALKERKPSVRLVVVSQRPEVSEWLETLEAGAWDYCAPPFEPARVRWILEGALKSRPASTQHLNLSRTSPFAPAPL